jgi:hypothetical protein
MLNFVSDKIFGNAQLKLYCINKMLNSNQEAARVHHYDIKKIAVTVMLAFMTCPAQISAGTPNIVSKEFCSLANFLQTKHAMVGILKTPRPLSS